MLTARTLAAGIQASDPARVEQSLLEFLRWTGDYDELLQPPME
jgi:hypothetical protein